MAFQKTPSYLYRKSPGKPYYLKLPIPPALRHHFPDASGKPRTHVVEALGTAKDNEAEQAKRPLLEHYWSAFRRLAAGQPLAVPKTVRSGYTPEELRAAMVEAKASEDSDTAEMVIFDAAQTMAEQIEAHHGLDAGTAAFNVATQVGRLTLLEALKQWNGGADVRESTKGKRAQVITELLSFLRVRDCLPDFVSEERAVAYVDWLNASKLGKSTKEDRLSTLNVLWKFLERRRQLPRNSSPWVNHEVTSKSTGKQAAVVETKRGWQEAELIKLFSAPDGEGTKSAHYTRPLFRELYALGLLTGMRLDEIVSLRPGAIEAIPGPEGKGVGGFWLSIEAAKTDAGIRTIPVVHETAVKVLQARMERQKEPSLSIFPECRPGGPDKKPSWHVQKALGRDRDRLGFGPEVDFHSTRRTFATMMENSHADVVHVQRYIGHRVGTLMLSVYSDGATRESLMKVAQLVRYPRMIEDAVSVAALPAARES